MKLKKLSELSQIVSSIAIIGSLIFIGIEVNQNTKATRASIRQSLATNDITYLSTFLNSVIIAEANAKQLNNIELTTTEFEQMVSQQYVNFMVFENAHYNYQQGFLEAELWDRYRNIIAGNMLADPHAREAWKRNQITFTKSFQNEVKHILTNVDIMNDPFVEYRNNRGIDSTNNDKETIDTVSKADNKK